MLRDCPEAKYLVSKLERQYNKGKALGIYTHKLGRAIYFMLKNKEAFKMKHFGKVRYSIVPLRPN